MNGQMTIFDFMPTVQTEPDVGEWVESHGAVIPAIMRKSYIGKKVVMDKSTVSRRCYKVGILEKVVPAVYYHNGKMVECDRSIVYDGSKQRNLITHYPGVNIYECLPWDAYPERMKAIGRAKE